MSDIERLVQDMRAGADESTAAAALLEAEGNRIRRSLAQADALTALILDRLRSEELSTHIEFSFEPHDAALIANMAEAYRALRAGETPALGATA